MSSSISKSDTEGSSTPTSSPSSRRRTLRIWVVVIGTLIISVMMFGVIRFQGHVTGEEFSPSHFQQRTFSFYEIPVLHLQITPIHRSSSTTVAGRYLRQKSLISAQSSSPSQWHLVWLSRGAIRQQPADAQLLVDQLKLEVGGDPYWERWSKDHPKHARELWPLIQQLAERELYVLMPRLFEIAQLEQTEGRFAAAADEYLKREYRLLIEDMRKAGQTDVADALLREAREAYPDDPLLSEMGVASTG